MSRPSFRTLRGPLLGSICVGLASQALAQEAAPETAPSATEAAASVSVAAPEATPEVTAEVPVAEGHAVEVETEHKWTDDVTFGVFVDAYAALRSDNNDVRPVAPVAGVGSPTGYPHEAYVSADGFGLAFAGGDLAYAGDKFGATVSLRFGPGVNRFYYGDQGPLGIDNITQAYLTYKPIDGLTLDLGQFYTLFGAEVAESWRNMNYSRGGLYYLMQPFWHTGLRANYAINDMVAVNAMVVNGVNTAFENNKSPTLGLQTVLTPMDELFVAVGYMGTLNPRDGGEGLGDVDGDPTTPPSEAVRFENFFDVVATLTFGDFKVVNNFDFNLYRDTGASDKENWWGISVAPGYSFTDQIGVAARVEYLSDSQNALFGMPGVTDTTSLTTLTATVDYKPIPDKACLVLRPEFRYEIASDDYFNDGDNKLTDQFWTVMLGAVVTSM